MFFENIDFLEFPGIFNMDFLDFLGGLKAISAPTFAKFLRTVVLLDSWQSLSRQYAQELSPSWNARKRVRAGRVEIPGNSRKSIFSKNIRKAA